MKHFYMFLLFMWCFAFYYRAIEDSSVLCFIMFLAMLLLFSSGINIVYIKKDEDYH